MNRKFHTVPADIAAGKFDDSTEFILDGIAEFHDSLLGREINQPGHCRLQPGNAKSLMTDTEVNPVPLESVIKREESGVDAFQPGTERIGDVDFLQCNRRSLTGVHPPDKPNRIFGGELKQPGVQGTG